MERVPAVRTGGASTIGPRPGGKIIFKRTFGRFSSSGDCTFKARPPYRSDRYGRSASLPSTVLFPLDTVVLHASQDRGRRSRGLSRDRHQTIGRRNRIPATADDFQNLSLRAGSIFNEDFLTTRQLRAVRLFEQDPRARGCSCCAESNKNEEPAKRKNLHGPTWALWRHESPKKSVFRDAHRKRLSTVSTATHWQTVQR